MGDVPRSQVTAGHAQVQRGLGDALQVQEISGHGYDHEPGTALHGDGLRLRDGRYGGVGGGG